MAAWNRRVEAENKKIKIAIVETESEQEEGWKKPKEKVVFTF